MKLIIFLLAFVVMMVNASAYLGHEQNTTFSLTISSNNATACNWSYIEYIPGETIFYNKPMTQNDRSFYLNISPNNYTELVDVCHGITCGDGSTYETGSICRSVTPTGTTISGSQTTLYILILVILVVFLVFSISGINRAVKGEWQIFYICVAYVLIFCLVFLFWNLSKNYLYDVPMLESVLFMAWIILGGLFFPFIIIVSAYILKRQGEALLEDDFVKEGYSRQEAKELAKSRRR